MGAAAGSARDLKKVGFIDDHIEYFQSSENWLAGLPMAVCTFSDVQECLTWVEQNDVDTLVADLRMPEVDGIVVLEKARKLRPLMQTVILTGFPPTPTQMRRAEAEGIKIYKKESLRDLQDNLERRAKIQSPNDLREMENRLKLLEPVHREWAADLVSLLKDKPELEKAWISSGEGPFSVQELIEDIEQLRPRGVEYVRLWRRALLTLLKGQRR